MQQRLPWEWSQHLLEDTGKPVSRWPVPGPSVCVLISSQQADKQKMEIHLHFLNACTVVSFIIYIPCFIHFDNYSDVIKQQYVNYSYIIMVHFCFSLFFKSLPVSMRQVLPRARLVICKGLFSHWNSSSHLLIHYVKTPTKPVFRPVPIFKLTCNNTWRCSNVHYYKLQHYTSFKTYVMC